MGRQITNLDRLHRYGIRISLQAVWTLKNWISFIQNTKQERKLHKMHAPGTWNNKINFCVPKVCIYLSVEHGFNTKLLAKNHFNPLFIPIVGLNLIIMSVKLQQASTTENFCFPNRKLIVSILSRIIHQNSISISPSYWFVHRCVCVSQLRDRNGGFCFTINTWVDGGRRGAARRQAVSSFPVYAFEKSVDPSYQWTPALAFPLSAGFGHFIAFGRIIW